MLKQSKTKQSFWRHHRVFLVILTMVVLILLILIGILGYQQYQANQYQNSISSFYNTNNLPLSGPLGQVVRSEPLGQTVPGGSAQRILYRTQRADGTPTFASGIVFIPSLSTTTPRPVVAWAHGTIGMGPQCAPSRNANSVASIDWISLMMQRGWVVAATDYAGLGTPGIEEYLIGNSESNDVLNSVRAARNIASAQAGNVFTVWGHSQGGHSALFTAKNAASYAPELQLVGTAATAPAAELVPLFNEQNGQAIDWVIGPEAIISWPSVYTNLNAQDVLTSAGKNNYQQIAQKCIDAAAISGIVRNGLHQQFFNTNIMNIPAWKTAAQAQTAPILKPNQPVFVGETLADQVVLPNTTALYIQQACAANSNLTSLWLNDVGHIQLQTVIAPAVINWLGDRFASRTNISTCNQPLPIAPAQSS